MWLNFSLEFHIKEEFDIRYVLQIGIFGAPKSVELLAVDVEFAVGGEDRQSFPTNSPGGLKDFEITGKPFRRTSLIGQVLIWMRRAIIEAEIFIYPYQNDFVYLISKLSREYR